MQMSQCAEINQLAMKVLEACLKYKLTIATAESCTGGLIAGALTEIPGSSDIFDRGYITYSNNAKYEMLGVPLEITNGPPGAVSKLVAEKMAEGALANSGASIAVAVTGIAGPGGGSTEKPVGLVYIAVKRKGLDAKIQECNFGDVGREAIRQQTVISALKMLLSAATDA
jgi:nicotinamide-nucleotide amidase